MGKQFCVDRRVEFCETDAAGIVHFSSFVLYMEQTEHAFLRYLGTSVILPNRLGGHTTGWPRVRVECDYMASAEFEQILQVKMGIERLGQKSVTYDFQFYRDQLLLAGGKITAVHCRFEEGKLLGQPIPAELRAKLQEYVI